MWIVLTLSAAFLAALEDAAAKAALRVSSPWVVAWAPFLFAAPILLLLVPFSKHEPLGAAFYATVAAMLPLELTAIFLYTHAIRVSPLSLTIPFLALTPVFSMPISYVLIGEKPGLSGALGVVLITAGAYTLNIQARHLGWTGPLRAVTKEPGSRMMVVVALIFGMTSTLGKLAVLHSGAIFFGAVYSLVLAVTVGAVAARFTPGIWGVVRDNLRAFTLLGVLYGGMALCHYAAIKIAPVSYMIALKRTSILFSVLLGRILFKEEALGERFLGAALMLAGAVLITLL